MTELSFRRLHPWGGLWLTTACLWCVNTRLYLYTVRPWCDINVFTSWHQKQASLQFMSCSFLPPGLPPSLFSPIFLSISLFLHPSLSPDVWTFVHCTEGVDSSDGRWPWSRLTLMWLKQALLVLLWLTWTEFWEEASVVFRQIYEVAVTINILSQI